MDCYSESEVYTGLSCQCGDFKCVLQRKYTYLLNNINSKNQLASEMFQKGVISFSEKKCIENISNDLERNREIIDLLYACKTLNHYLMFLDCLIANDQSHIVSEIKSKSTCIHASSGRPVTSPDYPCNGEYEYVDKIIIEDKLAVIGICCMNGFIYAICHMDPHIYIYMAKRPFIRLTFQEFDLPMTKNQFHIYDMVGCPEKNFLIVSDKANQCLWFADVSKKETSSFELKDGSPGRMSLSNYMPYCSDDEGYEDIYGESCYNKNFSNVEHDSSVKTNEVISNIECNDPASLVEKLLVEKIFSIDSKIQNESSSNSVSTSMKSCRDSGRTLLVVVKCDCQYYVHFYNALRRKFLKKIKLLLAQEFTVSNVIQRSSDGHMFICYGITDHGNKGNSPWYLGEYSPNGEMLQSYLSQPKVWIPRYIAMDEIDEQIIYAVSRFSGEILKLKCRDDDDMLLVSSILVKNGKFTMPSRLTFYHKSSDNRNGHFLLFVGQGEIKKACPPASIVVLRKVFD